jgi:DNA-directed RNA polymerase II subunit RPB2
MSFLYTYEDQDNVLNSYKRVWGYASDAIKHFEHFLDHMLPFIVSESGKIEVQSSDGKQKQIIQLKNVVIQKPTIDDSEANSKGIKSGKRTMLTPMEARNRGLTYSSQVLVDIEHTTFQLITKLINGEEKQEWIYKGSPLIFRESPLLEIPIMLRSKYCYLSDNSSGECWMDQGGYFIIRGNAKVLQPQKVQRNNMHLVKGSKHGSIDVDCRSRRDDEKFRSTSTLYMHMYGSPPAITADIPFLKAGIPIVGVFRLLGVESAEEILEIMWSNQPEINTDEASLRIFSYNLVNPYMTCPLEEILDYAGSVLNIPDGSPEKIRKQVSQQIFGELLPHVGFDDSKTTKMKKLAYLSIIIRRMIDVYLGKCEPDDRDFEGHKSVQMSAAILSIMFRQMFSNTMKLLRNRVYDRFNKGKHLDISSLMSESLTRDVLKAFSEGDVTVSKDASATTTSVIQMAQQVNPMGIQTHVQRVSTALPRDGKYKQLRGVDPTQLFVFCPTETPEGHGCGLLQNLSTFARVRVGVPLKSVEYAVLNLKITSTYSVKNGYDLIRPFSDFSDVDKKSSIVFVNSDPIGVTDIPAAFIYEARKARRNKQLPFDCSIVQSHHGICISCDMGVVVFPLIYVEEMNKFEEAKLCSSTSSEELWDSMCRLGMIEFVDAHEMLEYRVAFSQEDIQKSIENNDKFKFTHMAIHPSGFLGTCASSVPWPDHDQAPRVAYQAGMLKQAISTPAANLRNRMDLGYAYEFWYPQKPMADTAIAKSVKMNEWPMGENLIIAIAPYGGCTQEDSIIRSRASVDRGSGRVTVYRIFKAACRKRGSGDCEYFENPLHREGDMPKCEGIRGNVNYDKIGYDGLPEEGTPLYDNDVIIGRVSHSTELVAGSSETRDTRRDRSIILNCEDTEMYIVDKVMISITKEGCKCARVRLRSTRIPQEGDKISSRHGQKGTIGTLMREEDLPFVMSGNNAGMRPDAIINLHRCVIYKK